MFTQKARAFWPLLALLVLADCGTKQLAVEHLEPMSMPRQVIGDMLRLRLAYNTGIAFSIPVGAYSRWVISGFAAIVLIVIFRLYWQTGARDRWQAAALALVAGGAIGNALDRLRSPLGVVDFIDLGVGGHRFYTFNVADLGVTFGAALLALIVWRRGAQEDDTAPADPPAHA
jgi:signal peptidase II